MNLFTILFNACLHIIFVIVIEGIVLFAILLPIINWAVSNITETINNKIYNYINPTNNDTNTNANANANKNTNDKNKNLSFFIFDKTTDKNIQNPEWDTTNDANIYVNGQWIDNPNYDNSNDQVIYIKETETFEENPKYDSTHDMTKVKRIMSKSRWIDNPKYNNTKERRIFVNQKWIDNPNYDPMYTLLTPSQTTLMRYGVIDETLYFSNQKNVSYIIYGFILLILLTFMITVIIISKKYDTPIDYTFSIINTIIVIILIGGYGFVVMWYSVFNPYTLHMEKQVYEAILDFYKSA